MDYIREAVEYLKCYGDTQRSIINLKEEITKLDAELKGSAITYKDMPSGGGVVAAEDIMLNKIFRKEQAEKELKESIFIAKRIDRILSEMDTENENDKHGLILRRCFIERNKEIDMDRIADEMGYSRRHFYRIRQTALKKFAIQLFGITVIK